MPAMLGVPRFELVGQLIERTAGSADSLDHFAAELIGRQRLKPLSLAPEHANAGWAKHLVAGEGIEVRIQRRQV